MSDEIAYISICQTINEVEMSSQLRVIPAWLLFQLLSTSLGQLQDDTNIIGGRLGNETSKSTIKNAEMVSTNQTWQLINTLINTTRFKDGKCVTVGFNLQQNDMLFFHSLNSQLIYIESGNIPDLRKMMYHSWCVR